ncbi:MAG: hypothetical protein DHS20C10_01550 [marine bacterium B5-7]|nr:MAG: hypothetical protein DHS20C10_01550 [marine bacterium B5-7]
MSNRYDIITDQAGPHQDLVSVLAKHLTAAYLRPIPAQQQLAFDQFMTAYQHINQPIILDSGCGRGMSAQLLAKQHPEQMVLGIDKSLHRLTQPFLIEGNLCLMQANLIDAWRLLLAAKLPIVKHYLLYPNPWPKSSQFKRRFHGHPIFPAMLQLTPAIELRSNWKVYCQEFSLAYTQCTGQTLTLSEFNTDEPLTHFERKYLESNQPLFQLK